jgi:beta-galactosidase GanA
MEQIDEDIALMKDAGLNVARIGEFAWSRMEAKEGQYDFGWLHLVVEKLADAGVATIMCTPTSAPPAWLVHAHPSVLFVAEDGQPAQHGARRHACPNDPTYRLYCELITTALAKEFANDDRVIGWQIDNEVSSLTGAPCACPTCLAKFREKMRKRYGSIEALNASWGTALWSQTYDSFDQLPTPKKATWHHPSLRTAWTEFISDSYAAFVKHQADILHKLVTQPVGTDMMPSCAVDYGDIHKSLDLVQFNHYHSPETLWQAAFWFDMIRPLKEKPFWNTETQTCWNGSVAANGYKEPGFCRANSWLPVAMGGEANLYWLWRQHWSGQELMHGAVVTSTGRPMHMFSEVQEVSDGFRTAAEFINSTTVKKSGIALHFSHEAAWMFEHQPMLNGFEYLPALLSKAYRPMTQVNFRPDVILPSADISGYKMIFTPFLPALDEGNLRKRMKDWVEAGGIWIVGPLSDIRTPDATKFTHAPYGFLEDWAGIYCRHQIPADPHEFNLRWSAERESTGSIWYDVLESNGAVILAEYTDAPFAGMGAVTDMPFGDGRVIVLGTMPQPEDLQNLIINYAKDLGIQPSADASDNLVIVPREGEDGEAFIVIEIENRLGGLALTKPMTDILTGVQYEGIMTIDPYAVLILK